VQSYIRDKELDLVYHVLIAGCVGIFQRVGLQWFSVNHETELQDDLLL
jgi:hypothetical protein